MRFKGVFTYQLWISYSHKKYQLVGTYPNPVELEKEFDRYAEFHTVNGDRLKAVTQFKSLRAVRPL